MNSEQQCKNKKFVQGDMDTEDIFICKKTGNVCDDCQKLEEKQESYLAKCECGCTIVFTIVQATHFLCPQCLKRVFIGSLIAPSSNVYDSARILYQGHYPCRWMGDDLIESEEK